MLKATNNQTDDGVIVLVRIKIKGKTKTKTETNWVSYT